jgi:hypothetical protein
VGEQLRDVITRLMILRYGEQSKQKIAFITLDKHFLQGDALHPRLIEEVQAKKVDLHFYRTVDD